MKTWLKIILIIFGMIIIYELILTYTRFIKRRQIYQLALQKSKELNKPLMVIGDPDNGATNYIFGRSYGCGDVCLDLTGCPGCTNGIKETIENYLPKLDNNTYVIFISCVLEYVKTQNLDIIMNQIKRVSGGYYYIVSVEPFSLTALFYPTKFLTGESGPNQIILSEYPEKELRYLSL